MSRADIRKIQHNEDLFRHVTIVWKDSYLLNYFTFSKEEFLNSAYGWNEIRKTEKCWRTQHWSSTNYLWKQKEFLDAIFYLTLRRHCFCLAPTSLMVFFDKPLSWLTEYSEKKVPREKMFRIPFCTQEWKKIEQESILTFLKCV